MLLSLLIIVVLNVIVYKSFLNPIILQSILWLIYYLILSNNITSFDIKLEDAYYFLIYQLIGFSLGGFLYKIIYTEAEPNKEESSLKDDTTANITIINNNISLLYPFVIVILIVATLFLLRESDSVSLFNIQDLRETLVEDDGKKYGTYGLIQLIISVYILVYISIGTNISMKYLFLFLFFFVYTFLLGSRGQFIFFLGALLYILLWQKRINKYSFIIGVIVILGIMLAVTYSRASDIDGDFLVDTLLVYTTASLPALVIEQYHSPEIFGYHTFRIVYLWLNKFGFSFSIAPMLSEWTKTPLFTNVYSYIKPYYYDFGLAGIIILPGLLGFIYNLMYFRAKSGSQSSLLMLALFIYPMIMQTFDEQYFRWASNWIYIYILIKIITKIRIYGRWSSNSNIQS